MATAGPKTKPTNRKSDTGTLRKIRTVQNEMQPTQLNGIPPPPIEIENLPRACQEWLKITTELHRLNMLVEVDMTILSQLCAETQTYFDARKLSVPLIFKAPNSGYPMPNPHIAIANKALKNIREIAPLFGITPSARAKISAPMQQVDDPLDALIRQSQEAMNSKVKPIQLKAKPPKSRKAK